MEDILKNKRLGIALLVVGLVALNLIYLGDLIKGEPFIWIGPKSTVALIIANLIALAGLAIVMREGSTAGGSDS